MSSRLLKYACMTILFFLASYGLVVPQSYVINGTVTTQSNEAVASAQVEFVSETEPPNTFTTTTNASGHYEIVLDMETLIENRSLQEIIPTEFKLLQNYPNPAAGSTIIPFELHQPEHVTLFIYNIRGQRIRTLADDVYSTGTHHVRWDGRHANGSRLPAGIYFCHMVSMGKIQTKKMLLLEEGPLFSAHSGAPGFYPSLPKVSAGEYFSVCITGQSIKTYEQTGIYIDADKQLDFQVDSLETGTVTDRDGNVYKTIKIGDQWWMAENLKVTTYRNGDPIENVNDNSQWASLNTGAWCAYDNNPENADTYGLLYNWYAVNDSRNIAPAGWHVPTDEEWKQLEMALGMSRDEADDTSYRGTNEGSKLGGNADLWNSGDLKNNAEFGSSGFSALPGGWRRYINGYFDGLNINATFWSSTGIPNYYAWPRYLYHNSTDVYRNLGSKENGFSVRCVRD